jgi:hypothetical protein
MTQAPQAQDDVPTQPLCALDVAPPPPCPPSAEASATLEAAEPPASPAAVVQYYRDVDLNAALAPAAFGPLEKVGSAYVSRLAAPLLVQTPALRLADPPSGTHAVLSLPAGLLRFASAVEDRVLQACLACKQDWFKRPIEDGSLRASFKRFVCGERGTLKARVTPQTAVFDARGDHVDDDDEEGRRAILSGAGGAGVRCLLELSKVCFGRTEFGVTWTLVQAQQAPAPHDARPPPRCLIDPGAEEAAARRGAQPDPEIGEFL